jgi:cobalt-zinc-cadmium efflux system outer membrane protein
MQKLFYLIASIGIVSVLGAQPADMESALTLALQQNPRVRALHAEIQSAERLRQSASAIRAPSILLAPAITWGGTGEELLIHQPLEITGIRQTRIRTGQAQYELTLAQAMLELNDLLAEVAAAYYESVYRQRIAQVAHEALQIAQRTRDTIQQQVEAGARAGVDLVQAEIELERVRQYAMLRDSESRAAQERLKALLGGTLEPVQPSKQPPTQWLIRIHYTDAPLLQPYLAKLQLEQALAQQIRAEVLPDVGVQLRIERFQGERTRPAYGLTLSVPLLDYGALRNRLRAQNRLVEAQRLRLQEARLTLDAELRIAQQRLQQALNRAEAYQKTLLPRAQQLAQSAQIGLEAGQLSLLQLLEAQRTVRTVQEEALDAELQLKLSEVALKRLRGEFIPMEVNR